MAFEIFKKYKEAIEKDLKIDPMNINDKSIQMPSLKHFWVAKLVECRMDIINLEKEKKRLFKIFSNSDEMQEIAFKKDSLMSAFNNTPKVIEINEKIEELKLLVEYLTDVKYVFGRATDDIKNRIELEKAETL